jgi:cysteine desulfurase / selenocysteine lyase
MLCEDHQAILKVAPMDHNGELRFDQFLALLSKKTKLVAVAHVANSIGTINPIQKIAAAAHQAGAKLLVDGAQSAAHMPVDVQELDADFFVFSGHKLYGPTGIGILYGKAALLQEMPPAQGGGDMIESVSFEKTVYNVPPVKFEAGTPMIAEVIGLGAAIDYVSKIGLENINAWEHALLEYATEALQSIQGVRIIGPKKAKGAIISFIVDQVHPLDIGTLLDLKGVAIRTGHHCAQPTMRHFNIPATARISFGLYNTKEEVDSFIQHLHEVLDMLR